MFSSKRFQDNFKMSSSSRLADKFRDKNVNLKTSTGRLNQNKCLLETILTRAVSFSSEF